MYEPCTCCGGFEVTASSDDIGDYENIAQRIAHNIYAGAKLRNDPELLDQTASDILGKVKEGYGKNVINVAYDTPDFEMLRHLEQNVYSFSAAKNYQQLKDMSSALTVGDRLCTESEFMEQIQKMNLKYNRNWLATERTTAIAGGQMASRWVEFEENKEAMPMLQYSTVGDGNVRDSHRALDGIIKPVDDPFWTIYYPPNGWNCRCDVIQLPGQDIKPTSDTGVPQVIAPMFETNLAKQGLVFPKGHPYFDGVPKAELRRAMAYLPPRNSYMAVKGVQGKTIEVHLLHGDSELHKNLAVADDLIALGYKDIRLLPDMHEKEAALKAKFCPKDYKPHNIKKNPDAVLKDKNGNKMVCEFKTIESMHNFGRRCKEANEQAEYGVIKLIFNHPGKEDVSSYTKRAFKANQQLRGLIILDKKGSILSERYR